VAVVKENQVNIHQACIQILIQAKDWELPPAVSNNWRITNLPNGSWQLSGAVFYKIIDIAIVPATPLSKLSYLCFLDTFKNTFDQK